MFLFFSYFWFLFSFVFFYCQLCDNSFPSLYSFNFFLPHFLSPQNQSSSVFLQEKQKQASQESPPNMGETHSQTLGGKRPNWRSLLHWVTLIEVLIPTWKKWMKKYRNQRGCKLHCFLKKTHWNSLSFYSSKLEQLLNTAPKLLFLKD